MTDPMNNPPPEDAQNVFLTKSFWIPIATAVVGKVALRLQDFIELTPDDQTLIVGGLTALAIAIVRRFTTRPTYFVKKPAQPGD